MKDKTFRSDRVLSYFRAEWKVLLAVTVSGLIYNLGLLAGPWFEGRMTGYLVDVLKGAGTFSDMLLLVTGYAVTIVIVQSARYIKRFYVRRFANNVNHQEPGIFVSRFVGDVDTVLRPGLSVCLLMRAVSSVSWR